MDENKTNVNETDVESGVSFLDFWLVLKKFFWRIAILTCIVTVVAGVMLKLFIKTQYTAQAVIILNPALIYFDNSKDDLYDQRQAVQFGKELMPSVVTFVKTSKKLSKAIETESKTNELIEALSNGSLSVTNTEEELQIVLSYTTSTSPEVAVATLNKLVDVVCEVSKEATPQEEVNAPTDSGSAAQNASLTALADTSAEKVNYIYPWANALNADDYAEQAQSSNKWKLFTIIAFVAAFILAYLYYFIMTMVDSTIKSKSIIEQITGFHVMAYIEEGEDEKNKQKNTHRARK